MIHALILYKKQIFVSLVAGFLISIVSGFSIGAIRQKMTGTPLLTNNTSQVLSDIEVQEPGEIPKDLSTLGIVLVGYGGAGHDGGYLTDAIQVLYIDFKKSTLSLISIPRDLWVRAQGGNELKINAVMTNQTSAKNADTYLTGGATELKQIISQITGLSINYAVGIDFVGFERSIGIEMDGIEVDVAETLDDPWYPIRGEELNLCGMSPAEMTDVHQKYSGFELERQFKCRYKHIYYEPGLHHMEGGDALAYVRSRHGSAEGDVSRGKRQQEVLRAIGKKLLNLNSLNKIPGFFEQIVKHTKTDVNLEIVSYIAPALKSAVDFKVMTINLSPANVLTSSKSSGGAYIMIPKEGIHQWSQVHKFIVDSF